MKRINFLIMLLVIGSMELAAQTKIFIHKIDGSIDSLLLSQIRNISFKSGTISVLSQGLVAYYPFNGNAKDMSGNGFDGTVYGAQNAIDRFGNANSAYYFDGLSCILFGDILDSIFANQVARFTISGWVKPGAQNYNATIIAKSAGGYGPYQWSVTQVNDEMAAGIYSDSVASNFVEKYFVASSNSWHHFAMVFDGTLASDQRLKMFVDTLSTITHSRGAGTLGITTQNTRQELAVGGFRRTPQIMLESPFIGAIDDLCIYDRPLTYEEIVQIYKSGR